MIGLRAVVAALAISLVICYDEKFDNIDYDKILNDDALFTTYMACLLDKGPCTVEHSKDFREIMPEVIAEACAKCNAKQRANVRRIVKAIQEKRPDDYLAIRSKFDPKLEYEENFAAFMVRSD